MKFSILLFIVILSLQLSIHNSSASFFSLRLQINESITPDNIEALTTNRFIGRGLYTSGTWSPNGKWLAISSSTGVWLYSIENSKQEPISIGDSSKFIQSILFSPDGNLLAFGEGAFWAKEQYSIYIWSLSENRVIATLTGHTRNIAALEFSSDNKYLFSSGEDQYVNVWNLETYTLEKTFAEGTGVIYDLALNATNTILVTGDANGVLRFWDTATYTLKKEINYSGKTILNFKYVDVNQLAIAYSNPDATDAVIEIVDTTTYNIEAQLLGHSLAVITLQWNPEKEYLLSAGFDKTVRVWDARQDWQLVKTIPIEGDIYDLELSGDGQSMATIGTNIPNTRSIIHILDIDSGAETRAYTSQDLRSLQMAVNHSSNLAAIGTYNNGILIYDLKQGTIVSDLSGHRIPVEDLKFSLDDRWLVSASPDGTVKLWDVAQASLKASFAHPIEVTSASLSPDGKLLVSVSNNHVYLWDIATSSLITTLFEAECCLLQTGFSPDGQFIAYNGGSQGEILYLWNVASQKIEYTIDGFNTSITLVEFSPDGKYVGISDNDSQMYLLQTATMKLSPLPESLESLSKEIFFSPDSSMFVALYDLKGQVLFWDTNNNFLSRISLGDFINDATFAPDMNTFFTVDLNSAIREWSLEK